MATIDTQVSTHVRHQAHTSLGDMVRSAFDGFSAMMITLMDWQDRARQRRQLLGLSDQALRDFGAGRADAAGEGDKPFWQS